jgi:hypothetical protein
MWSLVKNLVQVVLDGARAYEEPGADLMVGEVIAGRRPGRCRREALGPDLLGSGGRAGVAAGRRVRLLPRPRARATAQELEELAADAGVADSPGAGEQIVARLDPASSAREGQKLELWFDPRKLHLFNPDNGAHLTL